MNTQLSQPSASKPSALAVMASKLSVDPSKLLQTLKATVFKGASDDELLALVVVANEYKLNPLTKEIYAFPAKGGGIVPVVSIDGWVSMVNDHPQMDGMEFAVEHDGDGKLYAITCKLWRKDRTRPIEVTEYLSECKRNTEPWKMEHRMLRHKALMQCARYAFGFSGVTDEDEAVDTPGMREAVGRTVEEPAGEQPARRTRGTRAAITDTQEAPEDQQESPAVVEETPADIEKRDKQRLLSEIRRNLNEFDEMNESRFEGMCRKAGLISTTSMLATLSFVKLRAVADNMGAVIRGEYKANGGEA